MYEELVKRCKTLRDYNGLVSDEMIQECWDCVGEAADAIEELQQTVEREKEYTQFWEDAAKTCKARYEELLRAAKKMHTWIFLNTGDEQKAYDECGLSDEMNAALGYGGRFEIVVPKEEQK